MSLLRVKRLAGGAPEGNSLMLPFGPYLGATPAARQPPPPVHPGLLAPPPAARGDLADPFLVRLQQPPCQFRNRGQIRYAADRPPRVDAAQKQDLGLIYVADAR